MKISIITPSYNQGRYIEATIQSVLNQPASVDEYIIVDGLSTDHTPEILKKYADHITLISEKDHGQTEALNKGFKRAQHEIIGWLNSDDLYTPGAIARVKKTFDENPTIELVYGNAYFINAEGKKIGTYPVKDISHGALLNACVLCQPAVFFKRALLEKYGFLNEQLRFCMDYEWWLRLVNAGVQSKYIPTLLAKQRLHDDAKTAALALEANAEVCELYQHYALPIPPDRLIRYAWLSHKKESASFFSTLKMLSQQYSFVWNKSTLCSLLISIIKKIYLRLP